MSAAELRAELDAARAQIERARHALALIPRAAVFAFDGALVHRFSGGDPRILADLNLPPNGVEGLPVGFTGATSSTWAIAAENARQTVLARVSATLRVRLGDRQYEIRSCPLPDGGGANVIVDLTPLAPPPWWTSDDDP